MVRSFQKNTVDVIKEKSMTVIEECIFSLRVSLELSNASNSDRERMNGLIDLMLNHVEKVNDYLNEKAKISN